MLAELLGGDTYGWAGTTAANMLGLTSQVAGRTTVAVVGRPPRDLPTIHFVSRAGRRARAVAKLRPVEIALLEVLDDYDDLVEQPEDARRQLLDLLTSGTLRPTALRRAAATEPRHVRERLEPLLDEAERHASGLVSA